MANRVLMKGNEAIAEAAIQAGCRHYFGYPITPQTEIAAYMAKRMPKIGGCFLQAESEIASINMVIGASAAGRRVMTSSSSPGIALKSEGLSYLAGCDLPAVVVNIQRGGPGLGGIQPSQADYFHATKSAGHGDFHMLALAPNSVQEMFDLTALAFDLADQYRITVMMLGDGMLGQMMEPIDISPKAEKAPVAKPWALTGTGMQRKANLVNSLYLLPQDLEDLNFARDKRYQEIEKNEARHEGYRLEDAEIIVVAYGAAARIAQNAVDAARENGVRAGLLRPITLWPFPKPALRALADQAKAFVVAELSMGQMIEDVELATRCLRPVHLVRHSGGIVPTPEEITQKILTAAE
ncbi:MAG: 3-methyl-2-oxobutanoate dehydrogenase subunit VorB [Oscillospiraceae bacterium]|jgi:2-oxoglutarate ferredoxin oxidoreductase subunit alpha|nr:3-methyl-2-oxobutanoate dehydrogenase subunit VorB [Oscillospiraceae bacterium]